MTGSDELIADVLREIADEAGAPEPMADLAWRAGRRRRAAGLAAAAVTGAAVIIVAVTVPLAATGSAAHGQPPVPAAGQQSVPASGQQEFPIALSTPVQFRQVASVSNAPCAAHSIGMADPTTHGCYYMTSTGMTVTAVRWAVVSALPSGAYGVNIGLVRDDASRFAALTREVYRLGYPHNELAVIAGGHVISASVVIEPIADGQALAIFNTRAQAEDFLQSMLGGR
jgi:hypothetical protein